MCVCMRACMCVVIYVTCAQSLCVFIGLNPSNPEESLELQVLQQFYEHLQIVLPIDELLPRLVSKKIITINDKILITESGRNINEKCRFFLDHYIAKPLSTGDPIPFYKLLQAMDTSVNGVTLATKIQQYLMIESLQDKISGEIICTNECAYTYFKVETGSDQSAYPGQMGHFFSSLCGLPSNEVNQIIQLTFLKW